MIDFFWSDRQGHRDRRAWALVVRGDEIRPFVGATIPGLIVVVSRESRKDGKWSHSTYRLAVAAGARFIGGHQGWETGTWLEGLAAATGAPGTPGTWDEVAAALRVSRGAAAGFVRVFRPGAADDLDAVEGALRDLAADVGARS